MKPASSQATRDGVEVVFQAFYRYAGVSLGEHLRYLFSSIWTVPSGLARIQSPQVSPWLGGVGIVSAVLMLVGLLEDVGLKDCCHNQRYWLIPVGYLAHRNSGGGYYVVISIFEAWLT